MCAAVVTVQELIVLIECHAHRTIQQRTPREHCVEALSAEDPDPHQLVQIERRDDQMPLSVEHDVTGHSKSSAGSESEQQSSLGLTNGLDGGALCCLRREKHLVQRVHTKVEWRKHLGLRG